MNGILGGPSALGSITSDLLDWISPSSQPTDPLNDCIKRSCVSMSPEEHLACVTSCLQATGPSATPGKTVVSANLSLGAPAMPWRAKSAAALQLQQAVNAALKAKGKPGISADGVLGPTTCAAAKYVDMDPGASVCQSYGTYPPASTTYSATPVPSDAATAAMYKPPSKSNALLIGAAVGGLALVGLVIAKKKGWIK